MIRKELRPRFPTISEEVRNIAVPLNDTGFLDRLAQDVDVVGLGLTWRFPELYEVVYGISHHLIRHVGFRTIAIEETPQAANQIDKFIKGGDLTVDEALKKAWHPWKTPTFARFLENLRLENETLDHQVDFDCVDTRPDNPDEGLFEGVDALLSEGRTPIVYLGGVAHVASDTIRVSVENKNRIPFGKHLKERRSVAWRPLAVTVGSVKNYLDEPFPLDVEAMLSDAG